MDLSNQVINLNEITDISGNDDLANKTQQEIIADHHQKGQITNKGWRNEDGELIPRFQQEPRMGMTMEDEYAIDQWVKQMRRDYPEIDPAICDLIASHCYLHPEKAQAFVKERTENPSTDKDHDKYFNEIGLERFNK